MKAVPDCLVTGYEGIEAMLVLPDPDDRHVLAAAMKCGAGTIVTFNLKDFPDAILAPLGVCAQHPDEFLEHAYDLIQWRLQGRQGRLCDVKKTAKICTRTVGRVSGFGACDDRCFAEASSR